MGDAADTRAFVAAQAFSMGDTIFKYIEIGEGFRFRKSSPLCIKTGPRRYRDTNLNKIFRTSVLTAVWKEEQK